MGFGKYNMLVRSNGWYIVICYKYTRPAAVVITTVALGRKRTVVLVMRELLSYN